MKRWLPLLPILAATLIGFALSSAGLLWGAAFATFNAFTHPRVFFTTRGAKPRSHAASLVTVAAAFIAGVALLPDRANWLIFLVPPVASSFIAFQRAAKHAATERLYTGELRERILAEQGGCIVCGSQDSLALDHRVAWQFITHPAVPHWGVCDPSVLVAGAPLSES